MSVEYKKTFECAYCEKSFAIDKDKVKQIEHIAKIKCPYCDDTEHIIEIRTTT